MYVYLKKLKKVKDPNRKKIKKRSAQELVVLNGKTTAHKTQEDPLNMDFPEVDGQIIESVLSDAYEELGHLPELNKLETITEEVSMVDEQEQDVVEVAAKPTPVIKGPNGNVVVLQKLKKLKKKKDKNQQTLHQFFNKK